MNRKPQPRRVVQQEWLKGPSGGLWDVLECGHALRYTGVEHKIRFCKNCPPLEPPEEQPPLMESLL